MENVKHGLEGLCWYKSTRLGPVIGALASQPSHLQFLLIWTYLTSLKSLKDHLNLFKEWVLNRY